MEIEEIVLELFQAKKSKKALLVRFLERYLTIRMEEMAWKQ